KPYIDDNHYHFRGSFPAIRPVTGRRPRGFSLFMKIFRDPCPVSLQVNYMKNKKRGLLWTGHAQKIDM
ncbi:TPA: hypothetical protein ACHG8Q_005195, partial [Escherichia coli]